MRAVIDTNALLSGLLWYGAPHQILEQVRAGTLSLVSSPALLAELAYVIGRAKFDEILTRSTTSREFALAVIWQLAEVVEPPPSPQPVCRDPDDDAPWPPHPRPLRSGSIELQHRVPIGANPLIRATAVPQPHCFHGIQQRFRAMRSLT